MLTRSHRVYVPSVRLARLVLGARRRVLKPDAAGAYKVGVGEPKDEPLVAKVDELARGALEADDNLANVRHLREHRGGLQYG